MFIKVTRSAAVSALAAGYEVRIDTTGEILQLCVALSKRACRRLLSRHADMAWEWTHMSISYSVRV